MVLAAIAEGVQLNKPDTKLLGRRQGTPGRREPKKKELAEHLVEELAAVKLEEWTGWCHYDTVEVLMPGMVKTRPRRAQAAPMRCVITDKNEALRTPENKLPVLLKARLEVLPW